MTANPNNPSSACAYCRAFTVGSPQTEDLVCGCEEFCGAPRCMAHPETIALLMAARRPPSPPAAVLATLAEVYPATPPESWVRLSDVVFQAPGSQPGVVILAVHAFGATVSQPIHPYPNNDREWIALLIEQAARYASWRVGCEQGAPLLRSGDGMAARCQWCSKPLSQHTLVTVPVLAVQAKDEGE